MELEGETWYLGRRNAETDKWHPATDNALGSESYGTATNPTGPDTFSIKYDTLNWNKILFAMGNLEYWMILERSVFENFAAETTCDRC